jgi:agmatine deiminase
MGGLVEQKLDPGQGPAALGFQRAPEWSDHVATWIGWPHHSADWPGKFAPIPWVFGEMVRYIVKGETARILVKDDAHQAKATRVLSKIGVDFDQVEFFQVPTDRGWTRDFGPLFIRNQTEVAISRFQFNAWANYPNYEKDNEAPNILAKQLGMKMFHPMCNGKPVVVEGGAIEVNGAGVLMTTEECLLHPTIQVRNPGMTKNDWETVFAEQFGVSSTLWLENGIVGDDTHGHIDDFCRFVNPNTLVLCEEKDKSDPNHRILEANRERLESTPFTVIRLPMPTPIIFDGVRVPASYGNFYISNQFVLVPVFNDPKDRIALGILADLFPDRTVVGIYAGDLIWGFGAIHCLTNDQPQAI